jgi:hypothetical protein
VISTITTSTLTVMTVLGWSAKLGGLSVASLLFFLLYRELAGAGGPRMQPLARNLALVIIPLALVFLAIAIDRLATLV